LEHTFSWFNPQEKHHHKIDEPQQHHRVTSPCESVKLYLFSYDIDICKREQSSNTCLEEERRISLFWSYTKKKKKKKENNNIIIIPGVTE